MQGCYLILCFVRCYKCSSVVKLCVLFCGINAVLLLNCVFLYCDKCRGVVEFCVVYGAINSQVVLNCVFCEV